MTSRGIALCPLAWAFEEGHRGLDHHTPKTEKHAFVEAEASQSSATVDREACLRRGRGNSGKNVPSSRNGHTRSEGRQFPPRARGRHTAALSEVVCSQATDGRNTSQPTGQDGTKNSLHGTDTRNREACLRRGRGNSKQRRKMRDKHWQAKKVND